MLSEANMLWCQLDGGRCTFPSAPAGAPEDPCIFLIHPHVVKQSRQVINHAKSVIISVLWHKLVYLIQECSAGNLK